MRILFDLIYPGYLRYYDAPIRALAARGHEVEVWFVNERKVPEGLVALRDEQRVHVGGRRPRVEPEHHVVRALRSAGDYVRYLDPAFADAEYLRRRAALKLPFGLRWLRRLRTLPAPVARRLVSLSLRLDAAAPVSSELARFVRERAPDVVVAGPGVYKGGVQADLLDAARAARVATVTAVASWDNLTTKGLLRGDADRVLVWNEALAEEAVELHHVPRSRIRVTGAAPFDKWFGRSPSRSAEEFAELVGLPPGRPYLLFVGSTARILAPSAELEFVKEWVSALRASADPRLPELGVVARPHPYSRPRWAEGDLASVPGATVWPRSSANPVDPRDRDEYFDSIYHAAAVVGINTSAMVEAAIIGRPVLTVTPHRFEGTQMATLHFRHLLPENGGFVHRASTLAEHLEQLSLVLGDEERERERLHAFVGRFIRPHGLARDATTTFADEIEAAVEAGPLPARTPSPGARVTVRALGALGFGWIDRTIGSGAFPQRLAARADADRSRLERIAARIDGNATGAPAALVRLTARVWGSGLERAAGRIGRWRLAYDDEANDPDE